MNRLIRVVGICLCLASVSASTVAANKQPRLASDAVIDAAERAPLNTFAESGRWNTPYAPFKVIGTIYYVGTSGVSSYLITSPKGHILIDGILAQSVPQIIGNVKALGFDIRDVKYLLNSHAHIDHAGGLAGLQRASGATMIASAADKPFLERGDIGHGPSGGMTFPPVRVDRVIGDGGTVRLGGLALTAHLTPGHSPGCTSWSMAAVGADRVRRQVFFHCSGTVAGQSLMPEAYPGIVANFRATFAKVRRYKADVFLGNHDNFFDLSEKRARQVAGDTNAFVDAGELQRFNTLMEQRFEAELGRKK